jgi:hypothetical protein
MLYLKGSQDGLQEPKLWLSDYLQEDEKEMGAL